MLSHRKRTSGRALRCTFIMSTLIGCASPEAPASERNGCLSQCIVLSRKVILGNETDSIWATGESVAVQTADGRYIVGPTDHPGSFIVYSKEGVLQRTFGRSGKGPGEYSDLLMLIRGTDNTISVIDMLQSRRTILSSSFEPLHVHSVPFQTFGASQGPTQLWVQSDIRSPALIGLPVHSISNTGSITQSFGSDGRYTNSETDGIKPIAAAVDGGVWVGDRTSYRFIKFDKFYKQVASVAVKSDLFDVPKDADPKRPKPVLASLHEDAQGRLWSIVVVPDPRWKPRGLPATRAERIRIGESRMTIAQVIEQRDWILEVIDPATSRRLGSYRSDGPIRQSPGDDNIYAKEEGSNGRIVFTVYERTLVKEKSQ